MAAKSPGRISPHLVAGLEGKVLTAEERDLFSIFPPAGVILFARNVDTREQLRRLCAEVDEVIGKASGLHPLIMADHEGGRISVLARAIGVPPTQMTIWKAFLKTGDPQLPAGVFSETARRMRSCGINMFLGPVADVNSEYLNPVIGTRAFSEAVGEVGEAVEMAVRALAGEQMLTSIKHFPGHGSSAGDSHLLLPVLGMTLDQLRKKDIVPFEKGIEAGADTVMTAHIAPLDRGIPSSLDPVVIRGILREELGFDGVIITDALEMAGILTGTGLVGAAGEVLKDRAGSTAARVLKCPAEGDVGWDDRNADDPSKEEIRLLKPAAVARTALEAGNDLLLFSRPAAEVYRELEEVATVLGGDDDFWDGAFKEISADSLPRIEALRRRIEGFQPPQQGSGSYPVFAGHAVEVMKDPRRLLPFGKGRVPIPVFYGEKEDFSQYPVARFIDMLVELTAGGGAGKAFDVEKLVPVTSARIARTHQPVDIFAFQSGPVEGPRVLVMLFRRPLTRGDIGRIGEGFDVVVTAERPWDSYCMKDGGAIITCYGISDSTAEGIAGILAGERV